MIRMILIGISILGLMGTRLARCEAQSISHTIYDVRGAKLYTETLGKGAPVLFLHGGLMFFDNAFAKQRDFFAANHFVIGIDQRGHGHSPDGPWTLSYKMMADDTAEVIRKLNVGPVDVVGHSDGADLAMLLARDYPQLVRRVVISGANLRGLPPADLESHKHWTPAQAGEKINGLAAKLPAYFRTDYASVSPDGPDHWMSMVAKCYWLWSESVVIEPSDLKSIAAPVLVMAGDHDFTSIEETTEIFRNLPQGQMIIVPGTGHGTFDSRPEFVNLAIAEFLR